MPASPTVCPSCGSPAAPDALFCRQCGRDFRLSPSVSTAPARKTISTRAKLLYAGLAIAVAAVFLTIFANHLPGGANPVIAEQPDVAMASMFTDVRLSPTVITAQEIDGALVFPLSLLLEKKIVQFDYQNGATTVPLLAYISPEGKLVTAIRLCEPCNSQNFRIEGTELACGNCETHWKLTNLEGVQGSCQKYPPAPIPSMVKGSNVEIPLKAITNWKIRI